ncbi:MAG: nuclear transport factor 2 family protein [Saprospiraceae bacterium]|nr:nuclear transport factor 2 family protein [Saprospiraceae bacterium]
MSYGHSSGTLRDKVGFVDEVVKGWSVFRSITFSDQTVRIVGDNAIVRHRLTGETFNINAVGKIDIHILLVWQKQKGIWKLLTRQAFKIPG